MNPLVEQLPVGAVQEDQVLSLTESVLRKILNHCRQNNTLDKLYNEFPSMATSGRCALCSFKGAFLVSLLINILIKRSFQKYPL